MKSTISKIDSIITSYMTANKMVGLSLGIVKDGEIFISKGYGLAEVNKSRLVNSLTTFQMCSITKLFTATAIMQLVEKGEIDISKKLIYYLPDFKMKDERYKDITIEHLLTHTSGLYWDMEIKNSPNDSSTLRKLVYSLKDKVLAFAPGTKFDATKTYSNAALDILGYLVQHISGLYYEDYIKQFILDKIDMSHSDIDYRNIPEEKRSIPHILKKSKPIVGGMVSENTEHAPSANLNSCSADMCLWMLHILNIYTKEDFNGVIKKTTLENMWSTRQIAPQNPKISVGLAWFITDSAEFGKYYWHVGKNPGHCSISMIFPDINFGLTIMTNGMYAEDVVWNKMPFEIIKLLRKESVK